jgi:hypothetical protein
MDFGAGWRRIVKTVGQGTWSSGSSSYLVIRDELGAIVECKVLYCTSLVQYRTIYRT